MDAVAVLPGNSTTDGHCRAGIGKVVLQAKESSMKRTHLVLGITGAVLVGGGAAAYVALAPSTWEREATSAIKGGDYEDAMKIAKRGLVEKPGNRRLQALFVAALALERSKDDSGSWYRYTVLNGPERFIGNLNTVGFLSKSTAIWPNGKERDLAVEVAEKELREIRQGFAAMGLSLESIDDLKPVATGAAKFFLGLKLDRDRKEVQRATLAAAKVLLLLEDKDGSRVLLQACEQARGMETGERVAALCLLGVRDLKVLQKIAFDSSQSLYGEARQALALTLWNLPEFQEGLPKLDPAKINTGDLADIFARAGINWSAFLTSEKDLGNFKAWPGASSFWISASGTAHGAADFGWSVPLVYSGGRKGIAAVGMIRKDRASVVPVDGFLPVEGEGYFPEIRSDSSEQRLAIKVGTRQEVTTEYREEFRYNPYLGGRLIKVPYQITGTVPYWAVLTFNPSSKRMERSGFRKGFDPFAKDIQTLASLPSTNPQS